MPQLRDRRRSPVQAPADGGARRRPVMLATLSVRVDPSAERMALESALEVGAKLILANVSTMPPYRMTLVFAPQYMTLPREEDLDAVRATASRAAELGIQTELLRVCSPHPVRTVLELAGERDVGLLVFGPDLRRTSRRQFARAARMVRERAPCLVWIAPDG